MAPINQVPPLLPHENYHPPQDMSCSQNDPDTLENSASDNLHLPVNPARHCLYHHHLTLRPSPPSLTDESSCIDNYEQRQDARGRDRCGSTASSLNSDNNVDFNLVDWHQLQQRVRLRESETALLRSQLAQMEAMRKSSMEDIMRLSARNAALEAKEKELEAAQASLQAMQMKEHVLLELLGEKDEQVEELELEFREFKQMYQHQIDALTR
jgi:hypothetical protein